MAFTAASFWLAFFIQAYAGQSPLMVALYLLPQAIAGLLWNFIAGAILHKVNNQLIMLVGCVAYLAANLLLVFIPDDTSSAAVWYWPFAFPALVLNVVGADFQFNVANMYIMQSFPSEQQSLAGSIFNTFIRLSTTIALGLTTVAFESTAKSIGQDTSTVLPYRRTFLVSVVFAGISIFFVPFIKIGTQGNIIREDDQKISRQNNNAISAANSYGENKALDSENNRSG